MLDKDKHEVMLKNILLDIYSNEKIASHLAFKGGTACYLFYDLPRFSVDLDFDLINPKLSNLISSEIRKIITEYGVIKDDRVKRNTIFFALSYDEKLHNIKVEISTRKYLNNKYNIINYLGYPILTMDKSSMMSNKLIAITDRKRLVGRDLFDAHFYLKKMWLVNEKLLTEKVHITKKEYFNNLVKFLEKNKNFNILQGLGELITEKQKVFVRTKLIDELIFLLKINEKT